MDPLIKLKKNENVIWVFQIYIKHAKFGIMMIKCKVKKKMLFNSHRLPVALSYIHVSQETSYPGVFHAHQV